MKVVIPAAGRGQRFAIEGFPSPKELLELGGRPLIWHALNEARRAGFESAVVVVSPIKRSLHDYLTRAGLPLRVEIVEQPEPVGIGDAMLRAWSGDPAGILLPDDVVIDGDHWEALLAKHAASGAAALCVRPVEPEAISRFGIAECDGDRVVRMVEKPPVGTTASNLAVFGRYVANSSVIEGLQAASVNGELELTYGFAGAINSPAGVRAVNFSGIAFDCGTPAAYAASLAAYAN